MNPSRSPQTAAELAEQVLAGSHQAAARVISLLENRQAEGLEALRTLYPRTGRAYTIGITGPPGAGKSTLVDALTRRFRAEGRTVGIVAVDPTSPFTGGAVLGDRVRMQDHATDPGVFVRSMATRGALGGLAATSADVIHVLDALGCGVILIETVGAGQGEVDVAAAADTVLVMTVPGLGDTVQTLKAGIMEVGDLFVVNKADRPDADRAVTEIKMMLGLGPERDWRPPVIKTVAVSGEGLEDLLTAVRAHRAHLEGSGGLGRRRRERLRAEVLRAVEGRIRERVVPQVEATGLFEELLEAVAQGRLDPHSAAERLTRGDGAETPT